MKIRIIPVAALCAATLVPFLANAAPGEHFIFNWDLDQDGTVTPAELQERRDIVFQMFDADLDGVLDAGEYVIFDETRAADMANNAGLGGGGYNGMDRVNTGMTFAFNDTDGDADVSHAEFIERTEAWFELIDRNRDGALTSSDFGRQ